MMFGVPWCVPSPLKHWGCGKGRLHSAVLLNKTSIGCRRLEEGPLLLVSGPCCVPGIPTSSARHTELLPPAQRPRVATRPLADSSGGLSPWGPPLDSSLSVPSTLATHPPTTRQNPRLAQIRMEHLHWGFYASILLLRVDLTNPSLLSSPLSLDSSPASFASRTF